MQAPSSDVGTVLGHRDPAQAACIMTLSGTTEYVNVIQGHHDSLIEDHRLEQGRGSEGRIGIVRGGQV